MPTDKSPHVIPVSDFAQAQANASDITSAIQPVVILLGSYDDKLSPYVRSLFIRGLLPRAADTSALIFDDGAATGCAGDLGASWPEVEKQPVLVGVTASDSPYADNHAHIVHLDKAGEELQWMFKLASLIAKCDDSGCQKAVTLVVIGGADREKTAIARAVRKRWPIVLVTGAGGVSNDVATAWKGQKQNPPEALPDDAVLCEILQDGNIYTFDLKENMDDLSRILSAQLQRDSAGLETVAYSYWDFDQAAVNRQNVFRRTENALLILGVVATFLAVLSKASLPDWIVNHPENHQDLIAFANAYEDFWKKALGYILIVLPIAVSIVTAANGRFRSGSKWILLRAAAEGLKREIFKFRTRSGGYSDSQCAQISSSAKLAAKMKEITQNLAQTEVNKASIARLVGRGKPDVDAKRDQEVKSMLSFLTPDDYVRERLLDQVKYYDKTIARLNRRMRNLYLTIFIAGGAGTLVAALGAPAWVALTTALATAFATKLEIDNTEDSLTQYNIALTGLNNVKVWWESLTPWEKRRGRNIDLLVEQTEEVLAGELTGWVQQMQTVLEKLTQKQDAAKKDDGKKDGTKPDGDKPNGDKPDANKPDANKPDADKPDADKPDADKPDADKPDADKPDTDKPDADKPDADKPDADKPDPNKPDSETPAQESADEQAQQEPTPDPKADNPDADSSDSDKPEGDKPDGDKK